MFFIEQLNLIMPRAPQVWLWPILDYCPKYHIDTAEELSSFISQIAVESNELTDLVENLKYSAQGLANTWPTRYSAERRPDPHKPGSFIHVPNALAVTLARLGPEAIANNAYANRNGNGNEASGDGWRYRGMGPIQYTGRYIREKFRNHTGIDVLTYPELLYTDPKVGIESACYFWKYKELDKFDDDMCVIKETKLVNGGTHGLARRQQYFNQSYKLLTT
jgi:putative chitinase